MYFVRYEDILLRKEETLRSLFCFLLNVADIEGTVIEAHIKRTIEEGAKEIYKPRRAKVDSNMECYTPEQVKYI